MKVYLATAGEYSDYRVQHVFAHREDAESYALSDDVAERELHDGPVEVRTWHRLYWHADRPDGEGGSLQNPNPYLTSELRDWDGRPGHVQHSWWGVRTRLEVEGWDLKRVRKTYSEQRAQHLASRT